MLEKNSILIVDDLPDNVEILEELLEGHYHLATAASGEECLRKMQDQRPDIVLLDVMMPVMDGYEVCRKIRALPQFAATKIIFISAKAQLKEKLEGYAAGGDDYIVKPFEKDCVMAKIQVFSRMVGFERALNKKLARLDYLAAHMSGVVSEIQDSCRLLNDPARLNAAHQARVDVVLRSSDRILKALNKKGADS